MKWQGNLDYGVNWIILTKSKFLRKSINIQYFLFCTFFQTISAPCYNYLKWLFDLFINITAILKNVFTDNDINEIGNLIWKKFNKVCFLTGYVPEHRRSTCSTVSNKTSGSTRRKLYLNFCHYVMLYLISLWFLLDEETSDNTSWYLNGGIG